VPGEWEDFFTGQRHTGPTDVEREMTHQRNPRLPPASLTHNVFTADPRHRPPNQPEDRKT
jgi:hypothetical protein